jgi:hypothetical protein
MTYIYVLMNSHFTNNFLMWSWLTPSFFDRVLHFYCVLLRYDSLYYQGGQTMHEACYLVHSYCKSFVNSGLNHWHVGRWDRVHVPHASDQKSNQMHCMDFFASVRRLASLVSCGVGIALFALTKLRSRAQMHPKNQNFFMEECKTQYSYSNLVRALPPL